MTWDCEAPIAYIVLIDEGAYQRGQSVFVEVASTNTIAHIIKWKCGCKVEQVSPHWLDGHIDATIL